MEKSEGWYCEHFDIRQTEREIPCKSLTVIQLGIDTRSHALPSGVLSARPHCLCKLPIMSHVQFKTTFNIILGFFYIVEDKKGLSLSMVEIFMSIQIVISDVASLYLTTKYFIKVYFNAIRKLRNS